MRNFINRHSPSSSFRPQSTTQNSLLANLFNRSIGKTSTSKILGRQQVGLNTLLLCHNKVFLMVP